MTIEVENSRDGESDNEEAGEFGEEVIRVVAVGETVVKAPEKSAGEGDFDMLPGGFIDGGEEADGAIVVGPFVKEVSESTNGADKNDAEPKVENIIHNSIITLVVYFGVEYDIIMGGSVAEWLKAHDSKSCGRVNRLVGSNPIASANPNE